MDVRLAVVASVAILAAVGGTLLWFPTMGGGEGSSPTVREGRTASEETGGDLQPTSDVQTSDAPTSDVQTGDVQTTDAPTTDAPTTTAQTTTPQEVDSDEEHSDPYDPYEVGPAITERTAPTHKEASWLVNFPKGYRAFEQKHELRRRLERRLEKYLKDPENTDIAKLGITKENLLDLLCLTEFLREPTSTERKTPYNKYARHNLVKLKCVEKVFLEKCEINWIPVTELRFLYRNLKTVVCKLLTGKYELGDLVDISNLTSILLNDLPIREFPHVLSDLPNLDTLAVNNTQVENVDFTNRKSFTALKYLSMLFYTTDKKGVFHKAEGTLSDVVGLRDGLPNLITVYTYGEEETRKWEERVKVYLPEREVEVKDMEGVL